MGVQNQISENSEASIVAPSDAWVSRSKQYTYSYLKLHQTILPRSIQVTVGIAAVEEVLPSFIGFSLSGGAIGVAMDRMQAEGITSGIDFKFFVNYTECDGIKAAAVAVEFMRKKNVDAVVAPPCLTAANVMAHLSTFYKKVILGWGFLTNSQLSHPEIYPYVAKLTPDSFAIINCVLQLFSTFEWNRVAIFYTSNEIRYCESIVDDTVEVFNEKTSYYVNVVQRTEWVRGDDVHFTNEMLRARKSAFQYRQLHGAYSFSQSLENSSLT
ncbi:hypothetical protein KIN20_014422 [Parelaphostrongylus tenuis]|uniref:Receptor ligand binding region domain-containing protein n=1 Tax=Parelaphostrongylus tenuis TaxID=148309 RepID=A0AAD5QLQ2_PARTN|nr:hypothetical protein KIN20_014422 [Parelaphostrongylus tenuis]